MSSNAEATNNLLFLHEKQVDKALDKVDDDNYKELLQGPIKSAQETLNAYKDVKGIDQVQVKALQEKIDLFKVAHGNPN